MERGDAQLRAGLSASEWVTGMLIMMLLTAQTGMMSGDRKFLHYGHFYA